MLRGILVTSVNLTDADGNPVTSLNLTDADGNPVTSVNLTDADGNVITSIEVDGSTFLDALTALLTPPTPETPQAPQTEAPATEPPQTEQGQATPGRAEAGRPRPAEESDVMHGHFTTPFSGGSPPSESGIRNVYSSGELAILERIGEADAALPISQENLSALLGEGSPIVLGNEAVRSQLETQFPIANAAVERVTTELMTRFPETNAAVERVSAELRMQVPPVVANLKTVDVSLRGGLDSVGGKVGDVRSRLNETLSMKAAENLPVILKGPVTIEGGSVSIAGGSVSINGTVPVRIENTEIFSQEFDDAQTLLRNLGS